MDSKFVSFANQLADIAGERIRQYFRKPFSSELKADQSPVTQADREAEKLMRDAIMKHYPAHSIWGEEFGKHNIDSDYVWVLDPVDGTKSFMAGIPTFGTLIALVHRGQPILGIIDQPINKERWVGGKGIASTLNSQPISSRKNSTLKDAIISTTSPDLLSADELAFFNRVRAKSARTIYGYDCYAYAMLASGYVDVVIETGLKPHDFCALAPVIENAGGIITDWSGKPITFNSDGRVIACGNKVIHSDVIKLL